MNMPKAFIFAGANASGKSTFISFLLEKKLIGGEYINPDLILKEELKLPETKENYIRAFQIAKNRRESALKMKKNVIIETVFSTEEKVKMIEDFKKNDYYVTFFFTGTDSVYVNTFYLTTRVKEGGHDVPVKKLIERRERGFKNVMKIIDKVDCFIAIDNSFIGSPPEILFGLYKGIPCYIGPNLDKHEWINKTGVTKEFFAKNFYVPNHETFEFCQLLNRELKSYNSILKKKYEEKNKILYKNAAVEDKTENPRKGIKSEFKGIE